jgi:hypothetical protein
MRSGHNFNLMRMVVQQYIQDRKGVKVLIMINSEREMQMLQHAYLIVKKYKDELNTTKQH